MIVNNIFLTQDLSKLHAENMHLFGLLITGNKPVDHIPAPLGDDKWWILDNGAFTTQGFNAAHWMSWIDATNDYKSKCICVVIPDVVGDSKKTIDLFHQYKEYPKGKGFNIAFVTQDGLDVDMVPWDDFSVLFIGGSDQHKMGREAGYLIEHGLSVGKHIHVGRVNTAFRLNHFWLCHTWDGTALTIKPEKYESIIVDGLNAVINKKNQPTLL